MDNYKPSEAARLLGVSVRTLQRWDVDGVLVANRTPTNRRFYTQVQIDEYFKTAEKSSIKLGYSEKVLGLGYAVEECEQGYLRVIGENADCRLLRGSDRGEAQVGNRGKLIYYSDGSSYGLTKFVVDNSLEFDVQKLLDDYNIKFNANHQYK